MIEGKFTVKKTFTDLPCAHRQWRHKGHCRFLHGYDRTITIWFACTEFDECGFVIDFSDLKDVRIMIQNKFDHTTLVNKDDPELATFLDLNRKGIIKLSILPNVGMEGSAKYVFEQTYRIITDKTKGRVWPYRVEVRENDKNAASYDFPYRV